jgi:hypothetical protein
MSDVIVFRTALLHEQQFVLGELAQAEIPAYARLETSSGVELAMPISQGQGLGAFFIVKTPAEAAMAARKVIRSLPVSHDSEPSVYGFSESQKEFWKEYSRIGLAAIAVVILLQTLLFLWIVNRG